MNTVSRSLTGTALIVLGAILIGFAVKMVLWMLIYGIPLFIIGFFILFNKKEDQIEEIKKPKK